MSDSGRRRNQELGLALVAMLYPSLGAWIYFVLLTGTRAASAAYAASKAIQFCLPLLAVKERHRFRLSPLWSRTKGVLTGLISGVIVSLVLLAAYRILLLHNTHLAEVVRGAIRGKMGTFGVNTPLRYLLLALFLSLLHSLLEEIYWRWLVFGLLRRHLALFSAMVLSGLAFMAHHVVVLESYIVGQHIWLVPLSLCVALAGIFWAWIYHRSGSLLGPWLSHLLVDLAVMGIGYGLLWRG